MTVANLRPNMSHWQERVDLAAAFRWTARLNFHEAVANHFSLAVNDDGTRFLINPNQMHFSRIRASDLLDLDANDPTAMEGPDAPDPTAWGLHGGLHRHCAHARCAMHVHSIHATVLACLQDPTLPPIDQNCATFFNRIAYDRDYGGLAFEDEGARCAQLFTDPKQKVLVLGNHGVMVIGDSVTYEIEPGLTAALQHTGLVVSANRTQMGFGLSQWPIFHWWEVWEPFLEEVRPEAVVVQTGIWDVQAVHGGERRRPRPEDPDWETQFAFLVGVALDVLTADGAHVYWLTMLPSCLLLFSVSVSTPANIFFFSYLSI